MSGAPDMDFPAGVIVHYLTPNRALDVIALAMVGDTQARQIATVFVETVAGMKRMPRHRPALCGCCPRALVGDFLVCVALPADDAGAHGFGFGLCDHCGADGSHLDANAAKALRRIWPDCRAVTVTHPKGGRA